MISRKIILLSSTILLLFIISNGYAEVQVNRDLASNTGEEVKVVPIETPALLVDSANDQARLLAAENSLILLNDVVRRLSSSHHSTQPHGSSTHVPSIHSSTHVPGTHSSTHVPSTQSSTRATQSSTHQPSTHTSTRLTKSSPHPSSTRHSTAITRTTRNTRASTTKTSKHTTPRPSSTRRRGTSKTTEATTTIDYPYTPYVPKEDKNYNYYDLKGKYRPRGGYNNNDDRSDDRSDDDDDDDDDSRDNYKDKEDMYASMTIWIRDADNWENQRYPNRYPGKKYNKNKDYEGVKFPVRHYKNIRKFPREKFSPLVSILPWLPIFYDRITYQTIIFSPAGGIYILPPLINFYGRRFAVAQLIKWGYASLVSSGAPPPPNVNVAPLVQPAPAAVPAPGAPVFDAKKERFVGGVKTEYANFEPRYSQTIKEGGRGYGNGGNYGGTGRQEVYARGGPQPGGGYN